MKSIRFAFCSVSLLLCLAAQVRGQEKAVQAGLNVPPAGYKALFNGKDLTGWKGLPLKANANPKKAGSFVPMTMPERLKATPEELAAAQKLGDESAHEHWKVEDGVFVFDGKGQNLCTEKDYGNFELYVDWKIKEKGDSGIYLRGSPQIQIWDPFTSPNFATGEQWGSGAVFNNRIHTKDPLVMADRPIGAWNTFWIKIVGDRVTVKLNGPTVADDVVMENYWEREKPLYPKGTIELQNHGNTLYFRNIYIKELPQ
jgi:3-keto-disaccharide hydrolase